jgi:hypothetical protein
LSWKVLTFREHLTGISNALPDPIFLGGGIHQILKGGILDIHRSFDEYGKLELYRRIIGALVLRGRIVAST